MSQSADLNALRDRILKNQKDNTVRTTDPSKTITVSREGTIHLGNEPEKQGGPLTVVPQEVFAGRHETDLAVARQYMPANTVPLRTEEGVNGFVYTFHTELGDEFTLFAFFDSANYQVQVLSPTIEKRFMSPHTGHLFSDGKICFGSAYGSGMPNLRDAYAKSVLWANGMSIATRTGQFPFSTNNANDAA